MTQTSSPGQRARMVARMRKANARRDWDDDDDLDPDLPSGRSAGSVEREGSFFDWTDNAWVNPDTGGQQDGGDQRARQYREMLRAYHKARTLQKVLTGPIKGATWKLKPGEGDAGEAKATEERLRRPANNGGMTTPIQDVIAQMVTSGSSYGRAFFVKQWKLDPKTRDGAAMYKQLAYRPATTCRLRRDTDGSFDGFEQDVMLYGADAIKSSSKWDGRPVIFPAKRSLVYVHNADQDPAQGVSDLDITWWCWRTQQKVMVLWLSFLEAQALPRTMVKHNGDEEKARQAANAIARTKSTGVAYFDGNQVDVSTLDLSGRGPQSFMDMVKYLDSCAAGSMLAGFTDLASSAADGHGSLALSSDQSDFFLQERIQTANAVASTITNYAVADMVRYNHGPDAALPTFEFDPLAGVDDQPVLTLLQALAPSRVTPMPNTFVDELAVEACRILHLDVDKVRAALEKAAADAEKQAAQLPGTNQVVQQAAAVQGAVGQVQRIAAKVAGPARVALPAAAPTSRVVVAHP